LNIRHLLRAVYSLALLLTLSGLPAQPWVQEESVPAEAPFEFVSGTVVEMSGGKLVVNRAVPGKPAENLTFIMNGETKVEGNLRVQARVTVGFKTADTGDLVAVRIIVRQGRK